MVSTYALDKSSSGASLEVRFHQNGLEGNRNVSVSSLAQSIRSDRSVKRLRQGYLPDTSNALLYRIEYLKMIFDPKQWQKEAAAILGTTIASLYATILVCLYVAFSFTELVTYPMYKEHLEKYGFFIYLFLVSDLYFLFIIYQVGIARCKRGEEHQPIVMENEKSHGSLTIRIGAVIFGIGTFIYLLLQLIDFFQMDTNSPCRHVAKGINVFLMLFFVILQAFVIFTFPRLNLLWHQLINRYGTMHVVATNIILWIRTLIKESLEEISEIEHEHSEERSEGNETDALGHAHSECNVFLDALRSSERSEEVCERFSHDILGDAIEKTTPYLYPFIIEFALIGASVSYIMSNHIGKRPEDPHIVPNKIRKPNVKKFLEKKDFSHSLKGIVAGLIILTIALVNLTLFFGLDVHEHTEDAAEKLSKISNTIINILGIFGLIIGIAEIQQLNNKNPNTHLSMEMDLDMKLLRFTSIFSFIYMIFTIITGVFNTNLIDFPDELHVINGCISITQIMLQIAFIDSLKNKVIPPDKEFSKPGRQITVFLFLFNLAQWLVFTFEIQKVRASLVEAEFYGFMPWIIIRRVTLPLAVFFRFHSSVVFIELFKEVYKEEEDDESGSQSRSENHRL